MFYALATNEDFIKEKVNLFIALAPIVRFKNAPNFLKYASIFQSCIQKEFRKRGMWFLFGKGIGDS